MCSYDSLYWTTIKEAIHYFEYIMQNVWLDKTQAGIKIAGRNNFR